VKKSPKQKPKRPTKKTRPEAQKLTNSPAKRPRWIRVAEWILGTLILTMGAIASVYQLWGGPPWPTVPSFSPGLPSSGPPLDVPFLVTNKSVFFRLDNLKIHCLVRLIKTTTKIFANDDVFATGSNTIEPTQSRSYTCLFNQYLRLPANERIVVAQIEFSSEYDHAWWPWGHRSDISSGIFTLNTNTIPPQWTPGAPLR
jgi:hypothetical protein